MMALMFSACENKGLTEQMSRSSILLLPFHFVCPIFYFGMSQNIVLFLKVKVINLLMFLLYPY